MKPLFSLPALQAAIASGAVELHLSEKRVDRLIELLGDSYLEVVKKVCAQLGSSDFCGHWPLQRPNIAACADVYGIMRDAFGERSEEEYAWYIKLGVRPREPLQSKQWILSFHPTRELRLLDGTLLKTTVADYDENDHE